MTRTVPVAVVFLALAPTAHAGWKVDRATAIARIVWHDPCGGHVALRWQLPTEQWQSAAVAWEQDCTITFNQARPTTWGTFCTRMLHEYGHAANFQDPSNAADPQHSSNPRSVMTPAPGGGHDFPLVPMERLPDGREVWEQADPRCAWRGRPFLERHGVLTPTRSRSRPRS